MHFIRINEAGEVFVNGDQPVSEEVGAFILRSLKLNSWNALEAEVPEGSAGTQTVIVEAVDEPLVAQRCLLSTSNLLHIVCPYGVEFSAQLELLSVDEWDRFHGHTTNGVSFVLSDEAQGQLFDEVDEYDDESITFQGNRIPVKPWLASDTALSGSEFWTQIYQNEQPGWEIERPAPALEDRIDSLKLPKSRVLVLGCGSGEDAALFARHGHVVTAVDFSAEALARAQKKHGSLPIQWVQRNVFDVNSDWLESFDIVVEHTFYCAVQPERRTELTNLWRKYLIPGGMLIGVFFTMDKRIGPPFGGSETEVRRRLEKSFQFLQWTRFRKSLAKRQGKELFVVAIKRSS